jgi:hypothetical protein
MDIKDQVQPDLEEKFQLSTDVNFSSDQQEFSGLESLKIEVKKKVEQQKVENIELRKRKTERTGLF